MTTSVIDQAVYQNLVETVGDDFIGEMVEAFLEEGSGFVSVLYESYQRKHIDEFRRAAHSLKSNAATFGATKLSDLAKELEMLARENNFPETIEKIDKISSAFDEARQALEI